MLITPDLLKAARGLAGWSVNALAERSDVSPDTIRSFESKRTKSLNSITQDNIETALKLAGVRFVEAGDIASGRGVVLTKD